MRKGVLFWEIKMYKPSCDETTYRPDAATSGVVLCLHTGCTIKRGVVDTMRFVAKISDTKMLFVSGGVLGESTTGLAHFAAFGANPQTARGGRHWWEGKKERWGRGGWEKRGGMERKR